MDIDVSPPCPAAIDCCVVIAGDDGEREGRGRTGSVVNALVPVMTGTFIFEILFF